MLVRHGYGVLLLDRRGEGKSDGDYNAFGWGGEPDLRRRSASSSARPTSTGDRRPRPLGRRRALLQTAAQTRAARRRLRGRRPALAREQLHVPGAARWLPIGGAAFWSVMTGATTVLANEGPPPDLLGLIAKIHAPVLLVYGSEGQASELALNPVYFDAARAPKALWKVPGAGHTEGLAAQPAAYEAARRRVLRPRAALTIRVRIRASLAGARSAPPTLQRPCPAPW